MSSKKVQYIDMNVKGIITCSEHGDFAMTPTQHLNGFGCPECWQEDFKEKDNNSVKFYHYYSQCFYYDENNIINFIVKVFPKNETVDVKIMLIDRNKTFSPNIYDYILLTADVKIVLIDRNKTSEKEIMKFSPNIYDYILLPKFDHNDAKKLAMNWKDFYIHNEVCRIMLNEAGIYLEDF